MLVPPWASDRSRSLSAAHDSEVVVIIGGVQLKLDQHSPAYIQTAHGQKHHYVVDNTSSHYSFDLQSQLRTGLYPHSCFAFRR